MNMLRIDDRLIHGQVIIGWLGQMNFDKLVLIHNDIPDDIIELYGNMLSGSIDFVPFNVGNVGELIINRNHSHFFIVKNITILKNNLRSVQDCKISLLNIGGLRSVENKIKLLDFVYMSRQEMDDLLFIRNTLKCKVNARELPYSNEFDIIRIIEEKEI